MSAPGASHLRPPRDPTEAQPPTKRKNQEDAWRPPVQRQRHQGPEVSLEVCPELEVRKEPPEAEERGFCPISPARFYRSVRLAEDQRQQGPSEEEKERLQMKRRLALLERWAEEVQAREIMMIRRKLATALQMPKLSQSEDMFWIKTTVEGVSYQTVECAGSSPTHAHM